MAFNKNLRNDTKKKTYNGLIWRKYQSINQSIKILYLEIFKKS